MNGNELRQAFLDFFEEKDHLIMPGAPLVPESDPTLLWINAGMAPFKPYFNGKKTPPDTRIATSQKCIRTNDIENVGKTARHQTFFEMLGNFSFGDYFKEKAIIWAWEFVTEVLKLDQKRLIATVYKNDEEAYDIWKNKVGIPRDKIVKMGKKENFWQIGTGPCGPCSEILYDKGKKYGQGGSIEEEGDRYLEIWNLVFTQYDYTEEGEFLPLPQKNIDTGMGLERVASLLQGVDSNFETDLLKPIIEKLEDNTGIDYQKNEEIITAYRVIADHIRSVTMAIVDGVLPANESRGYVIRRLLRRAVRFGGKLGFDKPFLYKLVSTVINVMAAGYPEITEKKGHAKKIIRSEEKQFFETLKQGLEILEDMIKSLKQKNQDILPGEDAFRLYDTYGFPLDLTRDILSEKGLKVDEEGFNQQMKKQKQRAREAREQTGFSDSGKGNIYFDLNDKFERSEFLGYRNLEITTKINAIIKDNELVDTLKKGNRAEVLLQRTPFYAESGGQPGDKGVLEINNNLAQVIDTHEKANLIVHQIRVEKGELEVNQAVKARVFTEKRKATARNHSCTHLLHRALKDILGDHIQQSGSLVSPKRLRFDFSHFSALDSKQIIKIENKVNKKIMDNLQAETLETTLEKAKDMGAIALFGEEYGEQVRVVKMGDYSLELCGGTHVSATGEIGLFKIVSESSIAAGIRRIEAVTGYNALRFVREKEEKINKIAGTLETDQNNIIDRIENIKEKQTELENKLNSLKDRLSNYKSRELLSNVKKIEDIKLLSAELNDFNNEELRNLADDLMNEIESGIIVLASRSENKVIFVIKVSKDLVKKGFHAGDIIKKVAQMAGGGGGGRPHLAQAGGSKPDKTDEALKEGENFVRDILKQK